MSSESLTVDMPLEAEPDPSDSGVQRDIELLMLRRLGERHADWRRVNWTKIASELGLSSVWQKAKPDAVWRTMSDEIIVAEAYSRIDELKAGHRRKLASDALKLMALQHTLRDRANVRCLLAVPEDLIGKLEGDGWFPVALRLAAEIAPVALLDVERKRLRDACGLQAQGQAHAKRASEGRAE